MARSDATEQQETVAEEVIQARQTDMTSLQSSDSRATTQIHRGLVPGCQMKDSWLVAKESPAQPKKLKESERAPDVPWFATFSYGRDMAHQITIHIGPVNEQVSESVNKIKNEVNPIMKELIGKEPSFPLSEVLNLEDHKDLLWFLVSDREPLPKTREGLLRIFESYVFGQLTDPIATMGLSRSEHLSLNKRKPNLSQEQYMKELEKLQAKVKSEYRQTITLYTSVLKTRIPWTLLLRDTMIHEMIHLALLEAGCEEWGDFGKEPVSIQGLSNLHYLVQEELFIRKIVSRYVGGGREDLIKFARANEVLNKLIRECTSLSQQEIVRPILYSGEDKLDFVFYVPKLKKGAQLTDKESEKIDFCVQDFRAIINPR